MTTTKEKIPTREFLLGAVTMAVYISGAKVPFTIKDMSRQELWERYKIIMGKK